MIHRAEKAWIVFDEMRSTTPGGRCMLSSRGWVWVVGPSDRRVQVLMGGSFRPQRLEIDHGGTFLLHRLTIGNLEQLVSGPISCRLIMDWGGVLLCGLVHPHDEVRIEIESLAGAQLAVALAGEYYDAAPVN